MQGGIEFRRSGTQMGSSALVCGTRGIQERGGLGVNASAWKPFAALWLAMGGMVSSEFQYTSRVSNRGDVESCGSSFSLAVFLLTGLPTEAVRRGFQLVSLEMPIVALAELSDFSIGNETRIGVVLPPFAEPSLVLDSWEDFDFLSDLFNRPAYVAGVATLVDVKHVVEQLSSADSLSQHGWGRSAHDKRTVADIIVEQIEVSNQLVLVGNGNASHELSQRLRVLNPRARHSRVDDKATLEPVLLANSSPAVGRSVRVVPPWLSLLKGLGGSTETNELLAYRRSRPFDPLRLSAWLADPPRELVRAKGTLWIASHPDQVFGYSCAGSIHRLFPAGRWWVSQTTGAWPECSSQRSWLLERWDPRFGDRRQEIVFAGVELDAERLNTGLDMCLLSDEETSDMLVSAQREQRGLTLQANGRRH